MSVSVVFCSTNSLKPKYVQFIIIENQEIFTRDKLESFGIHALKVQEMI